MWFVLLQKFGRAISRGPLHHLTFWIKPLAYIKADSWAFLLMIGGSSLWLGSYLTVITWLSPLLL